ncbi:hypothetical protein BT96DRAFT_300558 [Gymnopus androsaceus JB14]|uniref:Uncharacterized protein n=1 Tax=Gymnopus androsaceus JB14 TaxID=1447944 RepID=A0A6A4H2Y2_9AGAR|nr:hypothetical protein BT96DRAFT_300558 [Gymnopus androsaceus JB14]
MTSKIWVVLTNHERQDLHTSLIVRVSVYIVCVVETGHPILYSSSTSGNWLEIRLLSIVYPGEVKTRTASKSLGEWMGCEAFAAAPTSKDVFGSIIELEIRYLYHLVFLLNFKRMLQPES